MDTKHIIEHLARSFEHCTGFGHIHPYDLYRSWLEAVWTFLNAAVETATYRECLDRYTRKQGEVMGTLFTDYLDAAEQYPFRDILGELFMRLDVRSARAGQYFTPWNIALMMAQMQFDPEGFKLCVREKGVVTVCDPAVGSGVMLLAFANVVHDALGSWGLRHLRLYGMDIDIRCVWMCRIQIRLNGLDAFGRMGRLITQATNNNPVTPAVDQLLLPGVAA